MLISFGNSGQFGNLYLASAHRIAHALANGYKIHLYELGKYRHFFVADDPANAIRLGGPAPQRVAELSNQIMQRITRKGHFQLGAISIHFDRSGARYLGGTEITERARKHLAIHQGWSFRDKDSLKEQVEPVRRILEFKPDYRDAAKARFQRMRSDAKFVIGIHVRRGDYDKFCDGRYFFDDAVYLRMAAEAIRAGSFDPKQTVVTGFSNESLVWPAECGGARVVTEQGMWWEDFLCLSMCDLIIGPPSTFSGAASFAGDVRWFQIKDKHSVFDPARALPCLESGIQIQ